MAQPSALKSTPKTISDFEVMTSRTRKVDVGGGVTVELRPIPLSGLQRSLGLYLQIAQMAERGATLGEIIEALGGDLLHFLELTLVEIDTDQISLATAPPLLEALIEMNFSPAILGKWSGLLQKLIARVPGLEQAVLEQAKAKEKVSKRSSSSSKKRSRR